MKRQIIVPVFFLFFSLLSRHSFSQNDTLTYYLDKSGGLCVKEKASFVAKGIAQNEKFILSYYALATGKLYRLVSYTDFTMGVKDGPYQEYDTDGITIRTHGTYVNNKEHDQWVYWDEGFLTDSVLYENGNDLLHISFTYDKFRVRSRQLVDARTKTAEIITYNNKGDLEHVSKMIDGTGEQVYYYPEGQVKVIEKYKNNRMASTRYFKRDGTQVTEKQLSRLEGDNAEKWLPGGNSGPEYPGGQAGFMSFFRRNFKPPPSLGREGMPETVVVTFHLDKSGFATNISATGASNREIETEVITVFRRMPAWNMHGLPGFGPITYTLSL